MLSIIICNRDPAKWKFVTAMYAQVLRNVEHEIVGIHDASGICEGYNRGIDRARGDLLVFSHDDVEFLSNDFAEKLTRHLESFDVIGLAGATKCVGGGWADAHAPYLLGQIAQIIDNRLVVLFFGVRSTPRPAQVLDGAFVACRRSVCDTLRFDQQTFPGWHGYDSDFSYSAFRNEFKVAVASDLFAIHYSWGQHDDAWRSAMAAFLQKHNLPPPARRDGSHRSVLAATKGDALRLMKEALTLA